MKETTTTLKSEMGMIESPDIEQQHHYPVSPLIICLAAVFSPILVILIIVLILIS